MEGPLSIRDDFGVLGVYAHCHTCGRLFQYIYPHFIEVTITKKKEELNEQGNT